MRTALEMINILFVACETKVRRKEQEEAKTNNYCIWNTLESGIGVQVLTFSGFFWKKKNVCVRVCVCELRAQGYHLCTTFGWNVN